MTAETPSAEKMEFRAEVRQLLNILAHSLYTDREIFLRELISNASDALNRLQFETLTNRDVLDPDAELKITVTGSEDGKTLTIADTGIGMNHDELIENLGTIAHSGAAAFLESLKEGAKAGDIIGRFGVGFYSALMVADEITVTSRSYRPNEAAWSWTTQGGDSYTVTPADKASRGTTITLKLKEDASDFAKDWRLEQVIHKHSDFVAFPIYLKDNAQAVNRQTAIWRQTVASVTEEQANDFYRQLTLEFEQPLLRAHLNTDAPVQLYAMLFIPAKSERSVLAARREDGLKLYSRKVLIQDYCKDLLPSHFRFVQGVVDSEDLPLNVSRETVQSNKVMERIKTALTHKLIDELKKLAADDKDKYATFWNEFGVYVKEGLATDYAGREKLLPLLRFHSSKADGLVSLAEYVGRAQPSQKSVYYLLADSAGSAAISPHLDYFRRHNLEVLYLTDPIDNFMLAGLPEYEGFKVQSVDDPTLDLPKPDSKPEEAETPAGEFEGLVAKFKERLGDKVVDVRASERLVDSPVRLVSPDGSAAQEMVRIQRLLNKDFEMPKRVLEINRRHGLIRRLAELAAQPESALLQTCIDQLYESALLIEGLHPNPAEMLPRIQQLMEAAAGIPKSQ